LFRSSALHLIGQWMFAQPTFYLGLLVCVVACLLPEVLLTYIQRNYYPRLSDIVAEKEVVHRHRTKEADELGGGWTELTKRSGSITKLDKM
jgi:lipopolysaccharide export LptBFGC system permease protein LptF